LKFKELKVRRLFKQFFVAEKERIKKLEEEKLRKIKEEEERKEKEE
jgi:hypothetical protein